jgi:S1-C subfamily serine protease
MHRLSTLRIIPLLLLTFALATGTAHANEKVYQNILPSTVWVKAVLGPNKASFGSGSLVDAQRRWVITNNHVVDIQKQVTVFFPIQKEGDVVAEKLHYMVQEQKLAIPGRVIFRDVGHDLAIIELPQLPNEARAVKLAAKSAKPGQALHVIGNPNGPALWVYSTGTVRSVLNKAWTAMTSEGKSILLNARVVETQIPINPGDSGGPVVNDASELVAVVSSYNKAQQLVSTCIDLSEVKKALARAEMGETGDVIQVNDAQPASNPPVVNPPPGAGAASPPASGPIQDLPRRG